MEHLHERQPDVRAIWVGSGEGEAEFLSKIAAAQMQDVVRIVPWQHDVRLYLAAADVLLSTSRFESFGYVAAEALAMERPVVASDVTGTRDIMQRPFSEWLYPLDRTAQAAELILKLLKDPALSVATGGLGRSLVEKLFSIERMRESLMQAYGAVLNQPIPELTRQAVIA
jgi:glycosyltransferase involved in cell wall biosynthesis